MRKLAFLLVGLFVGFEYSSCLAAPRITACGTICREYPTGGSVEQGRCDGKSDGDSCNTITGEKRAVCRDLGGAKPSCAARECADDYVLWLTNTRKPAPQSQGRCFNRQKMDAWCREGCGCAEDEICVLNEIDFKVVDRSYTTPAFIGEEACHCVKNPNYVPPLQNCETKHALEEKIHPGRIQCCKWQEEQNLPVHWDETIHKCACNDTNKILNDKGQCVDKNDGTPDVEGDCRYTFRGAVTCNGKRVFKFTSFKLTAQQAKDWKLPSCKPGETVFVEERYKQDVENFRKLRDEVCGKPQSHLEDGWIAYDNDDGNDYEYLDAKNRIDAFMRSASSNANVWKNAEGQFNTARLASDLTAGVVLGTVGGIVSANVIKKKQLEKGFDALHCTVGGQTVADWGDEFSVGFRRY